MKTISKYTNLTPYLYFLSIIGFWFTTSNQNNGITAYLILLLGIPFIWQLIKPNRQLNFSLGIIFVCLSSYLILGYLSIQFNVIEWSDSIKNMLFFSGALIATNFMMSLWIIRNSMKSVF